MFKQKSWWTQGNDIDDMNTWKFQYTSWRPESILRQAAEQKVLIDDMESWKFQQAMRSQQAMWWTESLNRRAGGQGV